MEITADHCRENNIAILQKVGIKSATLKVVFCRGDVVLSS